MAVRTVADLLLARAGDERPGLLFEDRRWTWDEHVRASAVRAEWLGAVRGPGPFHVGLLLDNVPEFSFLLGAAALSGATVVGLNPTRRGAALARDVAATDCQLVVTEDRHLPLLEDLDLPVGPDRVRNVDDPAYERALDEWGPGSLEVVADPDPGDLFMLIFTSGTSGEPKAVRCTHAKVAGPGAHIAERFDLGPDDVCYLSMPLFHSNAIMAGWAPALAAGATIALRRRFTASGFLGDVRRFGATYANYVGKPLSYVLATPPRPDDAENPLRTVFGNEAADRDITRFAERFGCRVVDGFGSTEGGVSVGRTPDTPTGSIGRPAEGVRILDPETGEECPPAVFDEGGGLLNPDEAIGELVNTTGAGSFAGYYGNPDADRDRMRDGMYWSGDLAYADADGFYYFAGRTLDWLRVDGENLGAAPIERVLERHPDVVLAAVYPVPDERVGDQVMAALQLRDEASFDPDGFAGFLADQPDLGTKWAPRFVRIARDLPRTETHKVLKRALAGERWGCEDPVWWRPGRELSYSRLTPDEAARLSSTGARARD